MGAVKVAYYAATENDDRVAAVIPVSPVRLSCSYYLESEDADEFRANLETADRMEAEGRALDLFYVDFPIKEMFSAAAYLDKHGPLEKYNIVQHASNIRVPMFVLSGSLGDSHPPAGRAAGYDHRRRQQPARRIPGAGGRQPLADQHDAGGGRRSAGLAGVPVCGRRLGSGRLKEMASPERESISVVPIGYVRSRFSEYAPSDEMRRETSTIIVYPEYADGLMGLEPGDKILTLFALHRAVDSGYELRLHPGHNPANPIRGVFATRSQYRPNFIAATVAPHPGRACGRGQWQWNSGRC